MTYASVCDGIGACHEAWNDFGWECAFVSEIEPFPSEVVKQTWGFKNLGDFTKINRPGGPQTGPVDLLIGGTPCPSFSVAGQRCGLDDPRGNLAIEFALLAKRLSARWFIFENVPGLRTSYSGSDTTGVLHEGQDEWEDQEESDFHELLQAFQQCGYSCCWRSLDAQYAGLAQRRERVFIVGHAGTDWRGPAAVLLEPRSLLGDSPPSREKGQDHIICPTLRAGGNRTGGHRPPGTDVDTVDSLQVVQRHASLSGHAVYNEHLPTLRASGGDQAGGSEALVVPLLEVGQRCGLKSDLKDGLGIGNAGDPMFTLQRSTQHGVFFQESQYCIPFDTTQLSSPANYSVPQNGAPCHPFAATAHAPAVATQQYVRRLTPYECERLMGFSGTHTLIGTPRSRKLSDDMLVYLRRHRPELSDGDLSKFCADAPRYRAIGNSFPVPLIRWIGKRLGTVDGILKQLEDSEIPLEEDIQIEIEDEIEIELEA